jgi:predicted ABC-type ATPase
LILKLLKEGINGIINLFDIYLPIVDQVLIFDNSDGKHTLIAEKSVGEKLNEIDKGKFKELKNYYDTRRKN